jgi:hypothetical protein
MVKGSPQSTMVVIFEGDEAKRLQDTVFNSLKGAQNLGHPVNGSSLGLKGNLDKIALSEAIR